MPCTKYREIVIYQLWKVLETISPLLCSFWGKSKIKSLLPLAEGQKTLSYPRSFIGTRKSFVGIAVGRAGMLRNPHSIFPGIWSSRLRLTECGHHKWGWLKNFSGEKKENLMPTDLVCNKQKSKFLAGKKVLHAREKLGCT